MNKSSHDLIIRKIPKSRAQAWPSWVLCLAMAACGSKGSVDMKPDASGSNPDGGMFPSPDGGVHLNPDGGGEPGPDGGTLPNPDAGTDGLRFTDIDCVPNVISGSVTEGQTVSCIFRVEGTAGNSATLRCENAAGSDIDCSATSTMQIQPFGSNLLPIDDGLFILSTNGLAGTTAAVVWVADDGMNQAQYRFEATIEADDGVNESPSIEFDCGGSTDGTASVTAGQQLVCTIQLLDPDPDTLTWSYAVANGAVPVNEPAPFGGAGTAPYQVTWRWDTDASEAGTIWTFTFSVDDGTAPTVTRNLTVTTH